MQPNVPLDTTFPCPVPSCDYAPFTTLSLGVHTAIVHLGATVTRGQPPLRREAGRGGAVCEVGGCHAAFADVGGLADHLQRDHGEAQIPLALA